MPSIVNHENSLRGVLNFNGRFVSVEILDKARRAFLGFIERYKENEIEWQEIRDRNMPRKNGTYRRITLIHETFNHCRDKDAFLRLFFCQCRLYDMWQRKRMQFWQKIGICRSLSEMKGLTTERKFFLNTQMIFLYSTSKVGLCSTHMNVCL